MLNITKVFSSLICATASEHFNEMFDGVSRACLEVVTRAAEHAFGTIGRSDALYHNAEHTALVSLVGLEILKGKQSSEGGLDPAIWSNTVIALLFHDIGYVRGICAADNEYFLAAGAPGAIFRNVVGASDAVLMPIHVNRGKCHVEEFFAGNALVDTQFVSACIERTRFPVPDDPEYSRPDDYPGLVRAADLIGQLSDPRYLSKLSAIFYEFEEIGFNRTLGYRRPGDLLRAYPTFFAHSVQPYIADGEKYLGQTDDGREILNQLYANLATAREAAVPMPNVAAI
jgi:hypothetical protein